MRSYKFQKLNKTVVGFIGKAGSGKSTAASKFEEKGFVLIKFATPLKRMLTHGLGIENEILEHSELKNKPNRLLGGQTPRHAMQTLGTEWRDMMSRDLWMIHFYEASLKAGTNLIVTDDVRFDHEVEFLKNTYENVVLIQITRNSLNIDDPHVSEQGISYEPDMGVSNNTNKETFLRIIDGFCNSIVRRINEGKNNVNVRNHKS